jgi:Ca-activated chloride channel family protein
MKSYSSSLGKINPTVRSLFRRTLPFVALMWLVLFVFAGCVPESKDGGKGPIAGKSKRNNIELLFVYGSEKEKWLEDVTRRFNKLDKKIADGRSILVKAVPMGSGATVDGILSGRIKAHIASPASEAFIKIGNAKSRQKTGDDLIGHTRPLVLSPVVIAMWKPMAEAIGWGKKPLGWSDVLALADNPKGWAAYGKPQWGRFKFGHTSPGHSNSGLISLFAEVYAAVGKTRELTLQDVSNPKTGDYLESIERAVVHYGKSTGFFGRKMFANGPGYLSAAVLYENMVIESFRHKNKLPFPIVAIYPKEGTFWSDHPVGVVKRPWVTEAHKEAAEIYLEYLFDKPQQGKALVYGFRPGIPDVPLSAPIDADHGVDPSEPKTTLEVPSVDVMDAILALWLDRKKHSDIVLVLDTSGSMQKDEKMERAKQGALRLVKMLGDKDMFSFLPFNTTPMWAMKDVSIAGKRNHVYNSIKGLFASGGTAFYDSVSQAYEYLDRKHSTEKITAVVALTDGLDRDSKTPLQELLKRIEFEAETRPIRVFTIGYGHDADHKVLKSIAEATKAKSYKGTPENIEKVFLEISTFF